MTGPPGMSPPTTPTRRRGRRPPRTPGLPSPPSRSSPAATSGPVSTTRAKPTPYGWPCINSHFGLLDMCGFAKDDAFYYQAYWRPEPMVHLLPHWNWAGKEGQSIPVWAYSNGDSVELFLNGQSLGRKDLTPYRHVEWSVPYAPGTLEARAYRDGQVIATDKVETTGPPAALRLSTDTPTLAADGEEAAPVVVEVVDAQGRVVPTAGSTITFQVTGAGHNAGVGNGDPSDHDPDQSPTRRAFNGKAMVLVGANDRPGPITLTATSPGLTGATLKLQAGWGPMQETSLSLAKLSLLLTDRVPAALSPATPIHTGGYSRP